MVGKRAAAILRGGALMDRTATRIIGLVLVIALSACGGTVLQTSDEYVVNYPVALGGASRAGKEATEHCARYGKTATLVGASGNGLYQFACVAK